MTDDRPLLSSFLRRYKRNLVDCITGARIVHSATERFRESTQFDLRTPQYQSTDEQCGAIANFDADVTIDILATPMRGEATCALLERWEIRGIYHKLSAEELGAVPLTLKTFEECVILLRLVHATLRTLPAWNLFAKLKRRNASPRYDLTYRIYFGPTDMHAQFFEGNVLNLAHSAQLQCLSGERRLLVVVGNLQVKVTYLDHISKFLASSISSSAAPPPSPPLFTQQPVYVPPLPSFPPPAAPPPTLPPQQPSQPQAVYPPPPPPIPSSHPLPAPIPTIKAPPPLDLTPLPPVFKAPPPTTDPLAIPVKPLKLSNTALPTALSTPPLASDLLYNPLGGSSLPRKAERYNVLLVTAPDRYSSPTHASPQHHRPLQSTTELEFYRGTLSLLPGDLGSYGSHGSHHYRSPPPPLSPSAAAPPPYAAPRYVPSSAHAPPPHPPPPAAAAAAPFALFSSPPLPAPHLYSSPLSSSYPAAPLSFHQPPPPRVNSEPPPPTSPEEPPEDMMLSPAEN